MPRAGIHGGTAYLWVLRQPNGVNEGLHLVQRHALAVSTAEQAPRAPEHGVAEAELNEAARRRLRCRVSPRREVDRDARLGARHRGGLACRDLAVQAGGQVGVSRQRQFLFDSIGDDGV